jgi:hypothetical protein
MFFTMCPSDRNLQFAEVISRHMCWSEVSWAFLLSMCLRNIWNCYIVCDDVLEYVLKIFWRCISSWRLYSSYQIVRPTEWRVYSSLHSNHLCSLEILRNFMFYSSMYVSCYSFVLALILCPRWSTTCLGHVAMWVFKPSKLLLSIFYSLYFRWVTSWPKV